MEFVWLLRGRGMGGMFKLNEGFAPRREEFLITTLNDEGRCVVIMSPGEKIHWDLEGRNLPKEIHGLQLLPQMLVVFSSC